MLFTFALFFSSLYFKIARVHKKEERLTRTIRLQHFLVASAIMAILLYGVIYIVWYWFLLAGVVFSVMASLLITALQLGVFVDGKPLFGLSLIYKYLPFLSVAILLFSVALWIPKLFSI